MRKKIVLWRKRLIRTMASCPACQNRLRVDDEEPETHEFEPEGIVVGDRVPHRLHLVRVQHYYSENCGTTVDMAVSRTTYSNPQTEQIVKPSA